jgi:predicted nucleotidyltransferase
MVSMGQLKEIGQRIARAFDPERIILFGSHARGDATEDSDVDLLVIARTAAPKPKRSVPLYSMLRHYPFSKDILVYTPDEVDAYRHLPASLIARALDEGIVPYEKQA